MLMSVQKEKNVAESVVSEAHAGDSVYASLFEKINLNPVSALSALDIWQDPQAMSEASADERLTAGMQVFMECLAKAGTQVEKLDKALIDHHIAELDYQISRQLDAVLHHSEFQKVESLWRGVKSLVDKTDFRRNVKIELLDLSKDDLRQDFEDAPEIIQSGLYLQTYVAEYDTPGGEPIAALVSAWEFDASAQDVALLKNISRVAASAHMPFIGSVGPAFFQKETMEEVAAIKDIGNHFERAEYIKWNAFRETDDARYIGLVMPRVLGRLPYGPDTVPVRSFNYVEEVKGPDHHKYLWTNASFAFAANMVRSFVTNGWCVQIRGPQAGGAVQDLPIHLYDLGTGNQVKIPSEVMIPETREFEFANLGFIPLSYYKNRDYACFFSANSAQKPALYDTPDATANSRINARLPYIFLLSRIAHYLKIIQRENIGTTKDRRLLELELNNWIRGLVTEMTDPGDELQASHPLRDGKVVVEDIEDNPGFFRVKLYAVPHFQVEGMDVSLSLVSQMPKAKA
ncbi:TPA: type VI secretion system contractile sheath large subunit [Escherichia coli]